MSIPRRMVAGTHAKSMFGFMEIFQIISKVAMQCWVPTIHEWELLLLHAFFSSWCCHFLNLGYSGRYKHRLLLCFISHWWHLFICLSVLYVPSKKFVTLAFFLISLFFFILSLLLSSSNLCWPWINVPYQACLCNYFSQSMACLILLIVFSTEQ